MENKISRNYIHKTQVASTNSLLKEILSENTEPFYGVVYADSQTEGRGRQGRSFFSPAGGAYFSASYPLTGREKHIPFLTLLAGLAVNSVLRELCGVQAQIKWPNDIYLNGKKLCGILCELVSKGDFFCAVAGVGINLTASYSEIPEELREKITSLSLENAAVPQIETLIKAVTDTLDSFIYRMDYLNCIPSELIDLLNASSFLYGKRVTYNNENASCGKINPDGSITLTFADREEKVFYGEICI